LNKKNANQMRQVFLVPLEHGTAQTASSPVLPLPTHHKPQRPLLTSSLNTSQLLDTAAHSSEKKDHVFSTSMVDLRWSTTLQSGSMSCPPQGALKVDMKMEHFIFC
jgi:hypothetical protein